jgi:hypothetical protein
MEPKAQSKLLPIRSFDGDGGARRGIVMFKRVAVTISAVAFVMLAIALAPNLPAALATARATITNDDVKLKQPTVQQSCATLEVWFLDPTCRQKRVKSARTKHLATP